MLTGYFDDSGTHDDSEVIVYGGLLGNQNQWDYFETRWRECLAVPVDNRGPISQFSMAECVGGFGEFDGWGSGERDHCIYRFRQVILDSGLYGYACSIAKQDWDDLVRGADLLLVGDAERYCVTCCIVKGAQWAKESAPHDRDLSFVFDNRPHRNEANGVVLKVFQTAQEQENAKPNLHGPAFLNSRQFIPLQGADMVAWEFYTHAKAWLRHGPDAPRRPHFKKLLSSGRFVAQIANRAAIQRIIQSHLTDETFLGFSAKLREFESLKE